MDCYQEKIKEYKLKKDGPCSNDPLIQYVMEPKILEGAIEKAAKSADKSGKKHSHQRRIQNEILENFSQALVNAKIEIQNAKDFDGLYETIKRNRIKGAGELLVYDTALRIGHFLNIFPEKIYLHSGTRVGLERLRGGKIHKEHLGKNELPECFRSCSLTPWQLEDFFCVYKDTIQKCNEWPEEEE